MIIDPPTEAVKTSFEYNPETGQLLWKKARSHRVGKEAGHIAPTGYRTISWRGRSWPAHRLAWIWVHGRRPDGAIDHINGDRSDNRISNLRAVRNGDNNRNCAIGRDNTSGVMGVRWHRLRHKWHVQIRVNYRSIHVGYFDDMDQAVAARKAAERRYGFHPNHGRSPAGEGMARAAQGAAERKLR